MKDLKTPAAIGLCTVLPLLASTSVDAGIISNTSLGLGSITIGPSMSLLSWNIDNLDSAEFQLVADGSVSAQVVHLNAINAKIYGGNWSNKIVGINQDSSVKAVGTGPAAPGMGFFAGNEKVLQNGQINRGNVSAGFTSGSAEYIGFSFLHNSVTCYGWASITLTENWGNMGSLTINSWAYEDSGASIRAGAVPVPEPSETAAGLGALALGAAGLKRWRKRKATKAA